MHLILYLELMLLDVLVFQGLCCLCTVFATDEFSTICLLTANFLMIMLLCCDVLLTKTLSRHGDPEICLSTKVEQNQIFTLLNEKDGRNNLIA